MPLQNRVTPFSRIEFSPARGSWMGNRGCLHNQERRLVTAGWRHRRWICCVLEWRGRHRVVMRPRRYTELFFLDEAVALAAGHRPCAECRRPAYRSFLEAWTRAHGGSPTADSVDLVLHEQRTAPMRGGKRPRVRAAGLPSGAMVAFPGEPETAWLIHENLLLRWTHAGYAETRPLSEAGEVDLVTAPAIVSVLAAGYEPVLNQLTRKISSQPP